jgi:hypothetical protein
LRYPRKKVAEHGLSNQILPYCPFSSFASALKSVKRVKRDILWSAASTKILNVTDDQQASVVLEGHRCWWLNMVQNLSSTQDFRTLPFYWKS